MNNEKINEVGNLLDVDASDMQESKSKQIWNKLAFPLIQISTIILSLISGALLGYWENRDSSGYPYGFIFPRIFLLGPVALLGFSTGNILISSKSYKKAGLRGVFAIIIVFLSIIISVASPTFLYMAVENVPHFSGTVYYDTYRKPKYVR